MKTIIVTLQHEKVHLTNQLLSDLVAIREKPDHVVVVDNGSKSPESKLLLDSWSDFLGFDVVVKRLEENIGFTLGANYSLLEAEKISENALVFLISNDVRIRKPFIQQSEELILGKQVLLGNRYIYWNTGWNTFNGRVFDYLEGYFLAASTSVWRELGYFSPEYAPFDMEDVDLSTKAKSIGYELVSLNSPDIIHLGAGTYGYTPEREKITLRNKEIFRKKWMP